MFDSKTRLSLESLICLGNLYLSFCHLSKWDFLSFIYIIFFMYISLQQKVFAESKNLCSFTWILRSHPESQFQNRLQRVSCCSLGVASTEMRRDPQQGTTVVENVSHSSALESWAISKKGFLKPCHWGGWGNSGKINGQIIFFLKIKCHQYKCGPNRFREFINYWAK